MWTLEYLGGRTLEPGLSARKVPEALAAVSIIYANPH